MKFTRKSVVGLLVAMGIVFAGISFVYAQTAADADYNGDGVVDVDDFLLFIAKYGTNQGDGKYEAKYDLDSDGTIGISDFLAFIGFFGQTARNQEPVLKRIGDRGVSLGSSLTIELVASDPDGDTLTYSVSGHPDGSSLSGTTFSWTPASNQGDTEVTFTVEDGRGGTDTETLTLRVVAFQFKLIKHEVGTDVPSFVNIMFQVSNAEDEWVNFLETENFEVREDGQAVSPTESAMHIRKRDTIPYTLKTVLMLDTSTSVRSNLDQIKEAAIALVKNITEQQEIAVYEFSEDPVLLQDFTNDVAALIRAIQGIRLGFATTNLYGSVIEGSARWDDKYTSNEVQQGFLILLTDGSDTQGSRTLQEALRARGEKKIYTIGLGNEIDLDVLRQIGNAGSFSLSTVSELTDQFLDIQAEMALFADSFYQLNYMSPKRGDRNHTLALTVKGNRTNSTLRGNFNSRCFFSTRAKVVVNSSPCSRPEGIEELRIAEGDTVRLEAVTYLGDRVSQYSWTSSHSHIVSVVPDRVDASMALATAVGDSGQTATVTVYDRANGLDRRVKVVVQGVRTDTLPGGASLEMIWIAPGTFMMGSPSSEAGRYDNEGPVHRVTISKGFYLGKYEVTQGQWESVMGTTPWRGEDYVRSGSDYPAVYVSWDDAQEFISRLNSAAGSEVYRLPTEAEWEYACRTGTTTRWSFGDDESQLMHYAWYRDNALDAGERYGHRVGTKRANPWGLYDMHGNVWEWVQDRYGGYSSSSVVDPSGPLTGSNRVFRSGSFDALARQVRSADRGGTSPRSRGYSIGFRLLRRAN